MAALWRVALAVALEAALRAGTRRMAQWMHEQGLAEVTFGTCHADPFANVNTPDDRAQAEARLMAPPAP